MRPSIWLSLTILLLLGPSVRADDKDATRVEGTFTVPKEVASFQGRVVEIRLYKYDPRIADQAADLVEKVEIKDFAHTQGQEKKKDFVIGANGKREPQRSYYLTLFLLD